MIGPVQSVVLSSSAAVKGGPGVVYGLILTAGADAASVVLYDNTSGATPKLIGTVKAAINTSVEVSFPNGVAFGTGCYATITGTTPDVTVLYS